MILIDLNQVLISNLMVQVNCNPKTKVDENLVRHLALNCIRSYMKQFKATYGEAVLCCDSKKYWRRDIFPFYKSHRKKDRDSSGFDWETIFETLHKIRRELKEYFPYKVIEVEGAEADDVIAVLTKKFSASEPILVISNDRDFVQLLQYDNVTIYQPMKFGFVQKIGDTRDETHKLY